MTKLFCFCPCGTKGLYEIFTWNEEKFTLIMYHMALVDQGNSLLRIALALASRMEQVTPRHASFSDIHKVLLVVLTHTKKRINNILHYMRAQIFTEDSDSMIEL